MKLRNNCPFENNCTFLCVSIVREKKTFIFSFKATIQQTTVLFTKFCLKYELSALWIGYFSHKIVVNYYFHDDWIRLAGKKSSFFWFAISGESHCSLAWDIVRQWDTAAFIFSSQTKLYGFMSRVSISWGGWCRKPSRLYYRSKLHYCPFKFDYNFVESVSWWIAAFLLY